MPETSSAASPLTGGTRKQPPGTAYRNSDIEVDRKIVIATLHDEGARAHEEAYFIITLMMKHVARAPACHARARIYVILQDKTAGELNNNN